MPIAPPLFEVVPLPVEAFPHTIDLVERNTATGRDQGGGEVESWATVYSGLPCLVVPGGASEQMEWQQRGIAATHKCYFPYQDGVGIPQMGVRDRMRFGVTPDGQVRYLLVQWVQNVAEANVMLEVDALEQRRPA